MARSVGKIRPLVAISRGLSHEPEEKEISQRSPRRSRAKLRTKLKDTIRAEKEKRLKEKHRKIKPENSSVHV